MNKLSPNNLWTKFQKRRGEFQKQISKIIRISVNPLARQKATSKGKRDIRCVHRKKIGNGGNTISYDEGIHCLRNSGGKGRITLFLWIKGDSKLVKIMSIRNYYTFLLSFLLVFFGISSCRTKSFPFFWFIRFSSNFCMMLFFIDALPMTKVGFLPFTKTTIKQKGNCCNHLTTCNIYTRLW